MSCVYFTENKDQEVHNCRIHGECLLTSKTPDYPGCNNCQDKLLSNDPEFSTKWIDPLHVVDVRKHQTDALRDLIAGRSAFLVCGGPSAKPHLSHLNRRGVFSMAVNNAAGNIARPQAFVCSDPPLKFSHSVWEDPAVMKFVPTAKMKGSRSTLRRKDNGVFSKSPLSTVDCPNVWGFKRDDWLTTDNAFFSTDGACWGNLNSGVEKTGNKKTVCTMLIGIRMLRYLGAKRVFLLGVDFRMTPDYGYSFSQGRTKGASSSNNKQFAIVNEWLCKMQEDGVFSKYGLEIFNCYDRSGLRAFGYVPFADALEDVCGAVEEVPDLEGWYEKDKCPKCESFNIQPGDTCKCFGCKHEWKKEN